jgi:hypothetical protein
MMNQLPVAYPLLTQTVAYTGTAGTITNPVGDYTSLVRVVVSTAAFIKIAKSPTATTSDVYLAANTPEYFIIHPGEKVSAIQSAAGGSLYVTEMTR